MNMPSGKRIEQAVALIGIVLVMLVAFLSMGCAANHGEAATVAVNAGALNSERAEVYAKVAKDGVNALAPHVDAPGKILLPSIVKNIDASIEEDQSAAKQFRLAQVAIGGLKQDVLDAVASVASLRHSWPYRIGWWIVAAFWLIAICAAIHLIGGFVSRFLPPPYGTILSIAAKVCWPPAWGLWALSHVEKKAAVAQALTNANVESMVG